MRHTQAVHDAVTECLRENGITGHADTDTVAALIIAAIPDDGPEPDEEDD